MLYSKHKKIGVLQTPLPPLWLRNICTAPYEKSKRPENNKNFNLEETQGQPQKCHKFSHELSKAQKAIKLIYCPWAGGGGGGGIWIILALPKSVWKMLADYKNVNCLRDRRRQGDLNRMRTFVSLSQKRAAFTVLGILFLWKNSLPICVYNKTNNKLLQRLKRFQISLYNWCLFLKPTIWKPNDI